MDKIEIKQCSVLAAAKIKPNANAEAADDDVTIHQLTKYPFKMLNVGQCFTIGINDVRESTLRQTASRHNKETKRTFVVIKHGDPYNCFECARIA